MVTLRRRLAPVANTLFRVSWRLTRAMTMGARVIAHDGAGRVLLVKHTYRDGWYLPGGGIEAMEIAEDSARRELAEEGGLMAQGPMALFGVYANHANFKNDHVIVFETSTFTPCPTNSAGEIAERGFFAMDALPDDTTPGTLRRLQECFAGAPKIPTW